MNSIITKKRKLTKQDIGVIGEKVARKYLERKGYKFITKNYRLKYGEIDLIMSDKRCLVFIEVKSRLESEYAKSHVFDNITEYKKRKLRMLVEIFLGKESPQPKPDSIRIDVVGVIVPQGFLKSSRVVHLINAI